jgi:hypothetical protein
MKRKTLIRDLTIEQLREYNRKSQRKRREKIRQDMNDEQAFLEKQRASSKAYRERQKDTPEKSAELRKKEKELRRILAERKRGEVQCHKENG